MCTCLGKLKWIYYHGKLNAKFSAQRRVETTGKTGGVVPATGTIVNAGLHYPLYMCILHDYPQKYDNKKK